MKKVQDIFGILKGVVDKKVPELKRKVQKAEEADEKIAQFQRAIIDLQGYIERNRYDRTEVIETQNDISEYEEKITSLQGFKSGMGKVKEELSSAESFYKTYKEVINKPKVNALKEEYERLESELDRLENNIFACEINMDKLVRSAEVYAQSEEDLQRFEEEYNDLSLQAAKILSEIKALEK